MTGSERAGEPASIHVFELRPTHPKGFGGHVFELDSSADLFRCIQCRQYEVSVRDGDTGEIEPCPGKVAATMTLEERTTAARRWADHQGRHVRAAVELLHHHGTWFRRVDFLDAATKTYPDEGMVAIRWDAAEQFARHAPGSSTEVAILELAAALGSDRYRLASTGHDHARLVADAVAAAVGR